MDYRLFDYCKTAGDVTPGHWGHVMPRLRKSLKTQHR